MVYFGVKKKNAFVHTYEPTMTDWGMEWIPHVVLDVSFRFRIFKVSALTEYGGYCPTSALWNPATLGMHGLRLPYCGHRL